MLLLAALMVPVYATEYAADRWDVETIHFSVAPGTVGQIPLAIEPRSGLSYLELHVLKAWCNWRWVDACDVLPASFERYEGASCAAIDFALVPWGEPADIRFYIDDSMDPYEDEPLDEGERRSEIHLSAQRAWLASDAPCLEGGFYLEPTLTHEVGHILGLRHSCDDGEACIGSEKANATMYWAGGACDLSRASLGSWDIDVVTDLYGPAAQWRSEPAAPSGAVPLEVRYLLESDAPIDEVTWRFGDGAIATGAEVTHTYTEQGQLPVNVEYTFSTDICDAWTIGERQRAHVLACEPPEARFSYDTLDDGRIALVNLTPVTTYGCWDEVRWEVWSGDTRVEAYGAWAPEIDLPERGSYRVVLTVSGPGGAASTELTVASEDAPRTCGVPAPAGLLGLLLAAAAVARRRDAAGYQPPTSG